MRKTKTKPRRIWLKKWWKDWAKVDLTVLPVGIAIAYFLKDYANGFWLNLSTEIIGAYISVRFIDFLLRRNENRHNSRRELAGNINWFYDNANRLIPDFYDWRIRDLETEIKYFDDRWEERQKLLENDEKLLVEEIRISRKKIVEMALDYTNLYQTVDRAESNVYDNGSKIPPWWRDLSHSFREYRKTTINSQEIINPPLETALIELKQPGGLAPNELNILKDYVGKIQQLIEIRDSVEAEVRNHERLNYNLANNIYQESG